MATNIGHNLNVSHNVDNRCEQESASMTSNVMSRSQELSYVEALKSHQKLRLEHIRNETTKLSLFLQTLRKDVAKLEVRRQQQTTEGQDWAQKVSKLREDNRALRIECHCLSMEVDLYSSGELPLGHTNENFYQNVPTGPNGPLLPTRPVPSRVTARPNGPFLPSATPSPKPYPVQQMPRPPTQPPTYEESILYPPPRFSFLTGNANSDILRQVPPAPRPVWISPTVQQTMQPMPSLVHTLQTPPLPPRPNSTSPRTPPVSVAQASGQASGGEDGQRWVCEKCTVENHPALAYCEVCEMPRNGCLGTANRA